MAVLPVQLIPPTFPQGYCPPDAQAFANDLMAGTAVTSPIELDNIEVSDTPPTDTTKLWFKTSGGAPYGYPPIPLYKWHTTLAAWVAAHSLPPSPPSGATPYLIYPANLVAEADAATLDGGTAGVATISTGPFWEVDHTYDGRSLMAPGAIPGSNPAKTLAYQEPYGEGSHLQTADEVAQHSHPLDIAPSLKDGTRKVKIVTPGSGANGLQEGLSGTPLQSLEVLVNTYVSAQLAMLNVHPVRGTPLLKRTVRVWYIG